MEVIPVAVSSDTELVLAVLVVVVSSVSTARKDYSMEDQLARWID